MKQPLAWHRECLASSIAHHAERREHLKREAEELDRQEALDRFSAHQLVCAEREKKDAFDEKTYRARDRQKFMP